MTNILHKVAVPLPNSGTSRCALEAIQPYLKSKGFRHTILVLEFSQAAGQHICTHLLARSAGGLHVGLVILEYPIGF